jgi:hypothetical protein
MSCSSVDLVYLLGTFLIITVVRRSCPVRILRRPGKATPQFRQSAIPRAIGTRGQDKTRRLPFNGARDTGMRQSERAPEQVRMLDSVGHIPTRRLRAAAGGLNDFSRVVVDHVPMLHLVAAACRVPRKHGERTAAQICLERPHPPRAAGTLLRRTLCLLPVPLSFVVACRGCLSHLEGFIRRFPLTIVLFHNTDLLITLFTTRFLLTKSIRRTAGTKKSDK